MYRLVRFKLSSYSIFNGNFYFLIICASYLQKWFELDLTSDLDTWLVLEKCLHGHFLCETPNPDLIGVRNHTGNIVAAGT